MVTKNPTEYQASWTDIVAPKLMYSLSSGSTSALVNFLPVFYQDTMQFTKVQIGLLQTLPSVCFMLGPPFWGAVADRIQNQRLVHIFCIVTGAVLLYLMQFSTSLVMTAVLLLMGNFQSAPAGSLLDQAVLHLLTKTGGEYGKQRLFGAIGWGISAYVTGLIVAVAGITWAFNTSSLLAIVSLLVLRLIAPIQSGHAQGYSEIEAGGSQEPSISFSEGVHQLVKKMDVLVLLVCVFFMSLMYGVLSSYLTLNLYNLSGENAHIIGVAIMCETASELPAFFFSQKIINRLGTVKVLLLSIAGYGARITYLAFMTNPWGAIPFEFLHGVTFGISWAACTQYVYQAAPRGCEGTVMGLLAAVQNGLGRAVGTLVGGYFYQNFGAPTMWMLMDLGVPLSLICVTVFARLKSKDEINIEGGLLEKVELFSPHSAQKSPKYDSIN